MKTNTNTKKNANGLHAYILGSFFLAASPVVHSANIWDGGGINNSTLTAANWDNNVVPSAGNVSITFTGSTRTSVTWDALTGGNNLTSIIFAAGASAFTINTGTSTATQFINGGTVISNQSSFLQTLKPSANIFYAGAKTITGGTAGLALDGGIIFRGDSTWSGTNGLILTGTGNSTTSNIGESGTFSVGETNALTKQGSGKWTITGDAIFRGVTTISEGTLELQGSITSSSITNTAALIFNHAGDQSYGNTISGSGGTLTKQGVGTLTLSGSNSYTGGTTLNGGVLALGSANAIGSSGTISFGGGTLQFSASNTTDYSSRFSNAASQVYQIDTNGQEITLGTALSSSGGSLTKTGLGTLTLSGAHTYTGATTVSAGTLQLNGSTHASSTVAIGTAGILTGSGTVNGNATLTGNGIINTSSGTIAGTLGVAGGSWNGNGTVSGLVTASSGTFTISNSAILTASSGVNVTGGTVVVNGTLSGGLTAAAGTTVYGSGTVTGTTIISGNHNPGNSPGIQTFGNLSYTGGAAAVQWELNANSILNSPTVVFDQIIVDGDLDFTGATSLTLLFNGSGSTVNWTDSLWDSNQSWTIYDVSGTTTNFNNLQLTTIDWADSGGNLFNTSLNGSAFSLAKVGNDVVLNYTVIPEPEAALLGGLGIIFLLRRHRA